MLNPTVCVKLCGATSIFDSQFSFSPSITPHSWSIHLGQPAIWTLQLEGWADPIGRGI
jgi:hypothetical protein